MSDRGRRRDQVQYAAMDAVALNMPETAHRYVRNAIGKFVRKEKDMDLSTVSDLIKHGSSKGPYPQALATQIWESLLLLFTILRPSNAFHRPLPESDRNSTHDATSVLRPLLNYPEFAPGKIKIVPTDQWQYTLIDFQRESRYPIYFDTEGLYSKRSFGCDIAALTFYHVEQKKVLIIRINRFNCQDYQRVQAGIRGLAITRKFAVFGPEPFLHNLVDIKKLYNCQRMFGECQRSLKDMCAEIDVMVYKGQTMSDWGRNHLRWDQKQYAAMALRYLHEDQITRGDLRNGDYSKLLKDYEGVWP